MLAAINSWMDKKFYAGFHDNWDDTLFRETILQYLGPHQTILDLGAGAGILPQMNFKGLVAKVCGVDPDPRVIKNPFLDEGLTGIGERIPYPDKLFDVVFANNVLEHVVNPHHFLKEVRRVLKSKGWFLAKTPNRYHYVAMLARLTPHSVHELLVKIRGRGSEDTFPTWYRLNGRKTIQKHSERHGFNSLRIDLIEGRPEYLRINPISYFIGLCYERLVNSTDLLAPFRVILIVQLQKV